MRGIGIQKKTRFKILRRSFAPGSINRSLPNSRDALFAERHPDGYWVGEISASALSTATAISALSLAPDVPDRTDLIERGLQWLADHQNLDGGWGDTVKSLSNISTTMLCRAAIHLAGRTEPFRDALTKAESWLGERYGSTPEQLAEAVRQRYGKDHTFSVPILMNAALAGLVPWTEVPALPFELACLPQSWYRLARMPVVSYALPALIAIGQTIFHHKPPRTWFMRRSAACGHWAEFTGLGAHSTGKRRISGSDPTDQFCGDGPRRLRRSGRKPASGVTSFGSASNFFAALNPTRWKLAHR